MMLIKILVFSLVCICAILSLTKGQCVPVPPQTNFNFQEITGKWHLRYLAKEFVNTISRFELYFRIENEEVIMSATYIELESGENRNTSLGSRFRINPNNVSNIHYNVDPPFDVLSGNYTLHTDYNCYIITQGCPNVGDHLAEPTSICFRDNPPTQECENQAIAAFEAIGMNFTKMALDLAYRQTTVPVDNNL
ncbi:hypothetical protein C0J52_03363 [Blattella germanica]|nr:hypothetical protein C0J52_03363 [Blattella germanica]